MLAVLTLVVYFPQVTTDALATEEDLGETQSAPVSTGKQIMVPDTEAMRRLLVTWSKGCVGEHCGVPLSDGAMEALRNNYTNELGAITEGDLEELAMMTSLVASKVCCVIRLGLAHFKTAYSCVPSWNDLG